MKKNSTKLQLKTKTIRVLQPGELAGVNGGAPSNDPRLCRVRDSVGTLGGAPSNDPRLC
jgi:hypothetical protein